MVDFLEWKLKRIRQQERDDEVRKKIDRVIGSARRLAELERELLDTERCGEKSNLPQ